MRLPAVVRSPWWELGRRLLMAFGVLAATVLIVYLDRDGYNDAADGKVDFLDAMYYTTVTLSTTGYGDISPYSTQARMVNTFVITPLRVAFLVLLIGTTIEVLASQGREMFRAARFRRHMDEHLVVIGYGTKGRSAVETLINNGVARESIVIVDPSQAALGDAHADGIAVVTGDATRREVLRRAGVQRARQVIITTNRDDSTVLCTLNVRQMNPDAYVADVTLKIECYRKLASAELNKDLTAFTMNLMGPDAFLYGDYTMRRKLSAKRVGDCPASADTPGAQAPTMLRVISSWAAAGIAGLATVSVTAAANADATLIQRLLRPVCG